MHSVRLKNDNLSVERLPALAPGPLLQPPGLAAPGLGHHKTFAADELYALGRRLEGASSMLAERRIALERGL